MSIMVSRRMMLALTSLGSMGSMTVALAAPVSFRVPLTGAQQVPPVQTTGSGTASLSYDPSSRKVTWSVAFSGLSSAVTMAHFHGPASEGKNGPVVVWLSKHDEKPTSPFTGEATLTPEQAAQFAGGQWYVNVHTSDHPAGEIRGQVVPPKS